MAKRTIVLDPAWRSARPKPGDKDHPCDKSSLRRVDDPEGWERRGPVVRSEEILPGTGLVEVRPNVRRAPASEGCRTIFLGWSIRDVKRRAVIGEASEVWLLGARIDVRESLQQKARRSRTKNVHTWLYGFWAPKGAIVPDASSATVVGYDPWSLVHPGYFEVDPMAYRSRLGADVKDDRYEGAPTFAAAHLVVANGRPSTTVYTRLRSVDMAMVPSGALEALAASGISLPASSARGVLVPMVAGVMAGAALHWMGSHE